MPVTKVPPKVAITSPGSIPRKLRLFRDARLVLIILPTQAHKIALAAVAIIFAAWSKRSPKGSPAGLKKMTLTDSTIEAQVWRMMVTVFLAVVKKQLHRVVVREDRTPLRVEENISTQISLYLSLALLTPSLTLSESWRNRSLRSQ